MAMGSRYGGNGGASERERRRYPQQRASGPARIIIAKGIMRRVWANGGPGTSAERANGSGAGSRSS